MELTVTGSSSSGNGYILSNEREALLIEAGMPMRQTLKALNYERAKVVGCIVTHEHGDHAGRASEVLNNAIPLYASRGTIEGMEIKSSYKPRPFEGDPESGYKAVRLGGFTVIPFATRHDSKEPLGFYIWHQEAGGILFATDTFYIKPRFADLCNILIECNYSPELMAENVATGYDGMNEARAQRVRASHLSYDTCLAALQANDLTSVNNIVLIHLSHTNGDPQAFRQGIAAATRKSVHIATPGLKINFNNTPF